MSAKEAKAKTAKEEPKEQSKALANQWYAEFFQGMSLELWRRAIPIEQTEEEVALRSIKHRQSSTYGLHHHPTTRSAIPRSSGA